MLSATIARMRTLVSLAVFALALLAVPLNSPSAQQPTGTQRTPQFENDDVTVWKTVVPPNLPLAMHTHQHPRVIIPLTGGTMKVAYEDGSSETHTWEAGKAYWLSSAEGKKRHSDVNTGDKPIEVMVVELKKAD
jgi:beta-alanine degradation protein BauB